MRAVPVYAYNIHRNATTRRPESINFTYLDTPYSRDLRRDRTKIKKLVHTIKRVVGESCREFLHVHERSSFIRIMNSINITMFGYNIDGGGRYSVDRFAPVADLDVPVLDHIASAIHISNNTVNLPDIEWVVVIDQNSLHIGGGLVSKLGWYQQMEKPTKASCDQHFDEYGQINCAAYAINYLANRSKYNSRPTQKRINDDARRLQTDMGFLV